MFCRNCANPMDPNAVVCVKCGVPKGAGTNFCPNCGAQTVVGAAVCVNCGVALTQQIVGSGQKSKIAAGLLGIFLGCFGVHNFYLGFYGKAIAQLLITLLSLGFLSFVSWVWGLIEGIMILTGSINKDAQNMPLRD